MNYSQVYTNRRELKIPTIFSFLLISLIIFLIARFFLDTANFSTASKKEVSGIEITNIFPNQATIIWQTGEEKEAWVIYGLSEDGLDRIALDQKDADKNKGKYQNHYMVLPNLEEGKRYFFRLVVDNQLVGRDDGTPFTFSTVNENIGINNLHPAYGKVINQKGTPVENAVVSLFIKDAYTLSALSKSSGEWLIPLNYIINEKSNVLKTPAKNEKVTLEIVSEDGKRTKITADLSSISPTAESIVLGRDYNLLETEEVLSESTTIRRSSTVEITYPGNNATIPGNNPLIKGKAIAGNSVSVRLSNRQTATTTTTKVDNKGVWQVSLGKNLPSGAHQLTVQTQDVDGEDQILTRSFTIAKSGEQVLAEATGSATPTVTQTPSPTTTTPVPTENLTPTIPVSGGSITYLGVSSAALVLLGLGLLLLF